MSEQQPTCFPSLSLTEEEKYEAIEQALQKLARKGLIVDTGRRRWSKRTRGYRIVWAKLPGRNSTGGIRGQDLMRTLDRHRRVHKQT
jgi:hypothetical protein